MKVYLKDVTINSMLKAKTSCEEVISHIKLVFPQMLEDGTLIYDAEIDVTSNEFSISNKWEGNNEVLVLDIHSVGVLQLNTADFSHVVIY